MYGIKCLLVRFIISAKQIPKSEVGEIKQKRTIVEEDNSLDSLNISRREREDHF